MCAAETMGISDQKNLDEAVGLLRQSSMFHACSKETLAKMARDMDRLDFTKGDNLLDQGAPPRRWAGTGLGAHMNLYAVLVLYAVQAKR